MSELRVNKIAVNTDPSIELASAISTTANPTKLKLPTWTTAGRPASPEVSMIGYNTSLSIVEIYSGSIGGWVPIYQAGVYADSGPGRGYSIAQGADGVNVDGYTDNSMVQYTSNTDNQGATNGATKLSYSSGCPGSNAFCYHSGHQAGWWPMYHAIRVTTSEYGKVLNQIQWQTHVNAIGNVDIFGSNRDITVANYNNETLYTHLGRMHFGGGGGGSTDCTVYSRTFNSNNYGYKWYLIKGVDNNSSALSYPTEGSKGGWAMYRLRLNKI